MNAVRSVLERKPQATREEKQAEAEQRLSMREVKKHWMKMGRMKAAGADGKLREHLEELESSLQPSVVKVFNRCWEAGRIATRCLQGTLVTRLKGESRRLCQVVQADHAGAHSSQGVGEAGVRPPGRRCST